MNRGKGGRLKKLCCAYVCVCVLWVCIVCVGGISLSGSISVVIGWCVLLRREREKKKRCIGMYVYTHTNSCLHQNPCALQRWLAANALLPWQDPSNPTYIYIYVTCQFNPLMCVCVYIYPSAPLNVYSSLASLKKRGFQVSPRSSLDLAFCRWRSSTSVFSFVAPSISLLRMADVNFDHSCLDSYSSCSSSGVTSLGWIWAVLTSKSNSLTPVYSVQQGIDFPY